MGTAGQAFWDLGPLGFLRARDCQRRAVTAILYLNEPGWDDGGELACYLGAAAADELGTTAPEVTPMMMTMMMMMMMMMMTMMMTRMMMILCRSGAAGAAATVSS
jgi:hypothetical protein